MNNKYTVGDLFAGAGGLSKAFQEAGAEIVWANEFDRDACSLYRENFSEVCLDEADIRKVESKNIPNIDILISGFPCQPFSLAGKRMGIDDERENLFFEVLRILKAKKPKAFLLENVKVLQCHNNGNTFKKITEELQHEGYYIKFKVINAREYGNIPYNQERMYIVGFRDVKEYEIFKFPEKVHLAIDIEDMIDFNNKKEDRYYYKEDFKYYAKFKKDIKRKDRIYQLVFHAKNEDKYGIREYSFCPNLSLVAITQYVPIVIDNFNIRKLTPGECFNFKGYFNLKIPTKISDSKLYKYISRCSSITVVKRVAENIIKALDSNIQSVGLNNLFSSNVKNLQCEINQEMSMNNEEEFITQEIITDEIQEKTPIKNEKEFTLQKVIPALKRKNFLDVRYNHGSDEYGKDVTYKYNDNFGSIKYGAVQVKYGDISGSIKGEINSILSQIEDAFDMPYTDLKESRKNYISQLLVICSGRYTKNAKDKILEKFKKRYDVRFFDGQDINNLLE